MDITLKQKEEGAFYTLNFRKGDKVIAGLMEFAQQHNIGAAHISGLGAAEEVEIAYYNVDTKEYERKTFAEDVEILNLNGNIGVKEDGAHVVHIHGTFGRRDFSVFGGHIFEMTISGAGEIQIVAFDTIINRAFDEETGLTLMCPVKE